MSSQYIPCVIQGDPSLRAGNGIPARCVFLEEMAADLDGQDWLDKDNIGQVGIAGISLLNTGL